MLLALGKNSRPKTIASRPNDAVKQQKRKIVTETILASVKTIGTLGAMWCGYNTHVAATNERLVKTGLFLERKGMQISGFTVRLPFQIVKTIPLMPVNYSFELKAMTIEKIEFQLPGVFTIGPDSDPESLKKYAQFLSGDEKQREGIILGILEGETRFLAAGMTIEEIFNKRDQFKQGIITSVEEELKKFGLKIWNANIKELGDTPPNNYFYNMKQRTLQQADAYAKIEIAEAKKNSEVGQKERQNETRQKSASLESQSIVVENQMKQTIAESDALLTIKNAEMQRQGEMAKIAAQKEIEIAKIELTEQTLRNRELSKTRVEAEVSVRRSEGEKRVVEIDADAAFYKAKLEADQKRVKADAELYFQQKQSDGHLYAQSKTAEGIEAVYTAQSKGLEKMLSSLGGDTNALLRVRGIDTHLYENLAKEASEAVRGMQPKITIWNTGGASGANSDIASLLKGIASGVPPMFDALQGQLDLPFLKKQVEEKH